MNNNEGRFLVGSILREVRNARLNCNNPKNEQYKSGDDNKTYVKKIRRNGQTFPYASGQWQKKAIKEYAKSQGNSISEVVSITTTTADIDGHPHKNYEEDIMGFMIAKNKVISKEEHEKLSEEDKKSWEKAGAKGYKQDVTVKRRANLMLSTMQAIGNTRIVDEFASRETTKTPLPYVKEVYAADMNTSFILDIKNSGEFTTSDNVSAYRDYTNYDVKALGLIIDKDNKIRVDKDVKTKRISDTVKGLQFLQSKTTMANNLEDLSAKFMIFAEYSIGNSLFNNIFEDNQLKVDFLKEAIEENEPYRKSKIYIGVRSEYFKQETSEGNKKYLKEILERAFGEDDRFIIGAVNDVVEKYLAELEV